MADDRNHVPEMDSRALAAHELFQQLLALSPGGHETALRLTVRLGDGRYVGDLLLSENDVAALNDALISLNAYRADLEAETAPTGDTTAPEVLPDIDSSDVTAMVNALENLANGGH